jgi:hypothetical protein
MPLEFGDRFIALQATFQLELELLQSSGRPLILRGKLNGAALLYSFNLPK